MQRFQIHIMLKSFLMRGVITEIMTLQPLRRAFSSHPTLFLESPWRQGREPHWFFSARQLSSLVSLNPLWRNI